MSDVPKNVSEQLQQIKQYFENFQKNTIIYIIIFEVNKEKTYYYIGTTNDTKRRLNEHNDGKGCEFTSKMIREHSTIQWREIDSFKSTSLLDELATTLLYMKIYGIDNVRGGPFAFIDIYVETRISIKNLINFMFNSDYKQEVIPLKEVDKKIFGYFSNYLKYFKSFETIDKEIKDLTLKVEDKNKEIEN